MALASLHDRTTGAACLLFRLQRGCVIAHWGLTIAEIKFVECVVIGSRVVAVILPGKIVQDLKPFTINGIEEVLIVRMNLMDERDLMVFCSVGC